LGEEKSSPFFKMKTIYIIKLNREDFINLVGNKKSTGYSYYEIKNKPHKIFIKNSKSKEVFKRTLEHELSHIFLRTLDLKNKINKKEFKEVLKDINFRDYNKKVYDTSFKLREEYLADFISYVIFGSKFEKKYIKTNYPKNYKIVKQEEKKFNPKLTYI